VTPSLGGRLLGHRKATSRAYLGQEMATSEPYVYLYDQYVMVNGIRQSDPHAVTGDVITHAVKYVNRGGPGNVTVHWRSWTGEEWDDVAYMDRDEVHTFTYTYSFPNIPKGKSTWASYRASPGEGIAGGTSVTSDNPYCNVRIAKPKTGDSFPIGTVEVVGTVEADGYAVEGLPVHVYFEGPSGKKRYNTTTGSGTYAGSFTVTGTVDAGGSWSIWAETESFNAVFPDGRTASFPSQKSNVVKINVAAPPAGQPPPEEEPGSQPPPEDEPPTIRESLRSLFKDLRPGIILPKYYRMRPTERW